ncbi:sialyltransferase-like protein 2 isoform X2 [Physcomitrium patens]|uniref:sialyltransferase-like protein 2 isoform X2 n=1 Tax=Physcomitrium patens TaxID=3218 RepID=UPI003CCE51FF
MTKLERAPSRLLKLLMLALVSSAVYYVKLASNARSRSNRYMNLDADRSTMVNFQQEFIQCVREKGMGMDVRPVTECKVKLLFTDPSAAIWKEPASGELEGIVYEFDLCSLIGLWEKVRNSITILTREYIDGLPNGWRDYAWKRINKGYRSMCSNITLCNEKLAPVIPSTPPFIPRQYGRCAVVGNSNDLLQDLFGAEIDEFDAVIRMNGAPVENYTHYVGEKTTFRILNRGSAKALDKIVALSASAQETIIVKTTIHDFMSRMIREVPILNPVYLMVGAPLGKSAKGTGVKAIEFALSVCEMVDIYGFTVDPGYLEWTRYFSESRRGHAPLQGRAYYQTMECLGFIRIHSPQRKFSTNKQRVNLNSSIWNAAAHLDLSLKRAHRSNLLDACKLWAQGATLTLNMSTSAMDHQKAVSGIRQYALDQESGSGMLCIKPE